jgi:uncharacterized membrane protein (TIGR02234 family)
MSGRRELAAVVGLLIVGALLSWLSASRSAPLALAVLAGAGALLATRGRARRLLGLPVVGAGAAIAGVGWPGASIVAALVVAVAGVLTALHGGRWPALGARYEAPGAPRPREPVGAAAQWDALDRGEDPT